jgi:Pretoxin HINT domain
MLRPIEQVKVGDVVLSKSEATGEVAAKRVLKTFVRDGVAVLNLRFGDEVIGTTHEHPFYAQGQGFVKAGELGVGTSIVTRAGPSLKLSAATTKNTARVYNFEVEGFHTYFVGRSGVWVHNTCFTEPIEEFQVGEFSKFHTISRRSGRGDEIAGHEVLVFCWLQHKNLRTNRGGPNPVLALSKDVHTAVTNIQNEGRLLDTAVVGNWTPQQVVNANIEVLREYNRRFQNVPGAKVIPEASINAVEQQAMAYAAQLTP